MKNSFITSGPGITLILSTTGIAILALTTLVKLTSVQSYANFYYRQNVKTVELKPVLLKTGNEQKIKT